MLQSALRAETSDPAAEVVQRHRSLALTFNFGLGMFLCAGIWQLVDWPSVTWAGTALKSSALCAGFGLAGTAWIASSALVPWQKVASIVALAVVTIYPPIEATRNFDPQEGLLTPGRIEHGRFIHDGLGLSFDVPPDWETNLQAEGLGGSGARPRPKTGTRLRIDESGIFFRMRPPSPQAGASQDLVLVTVQGGPLYFRSLSNLVANVITIQRRYASRSTVEIRKPTHCYRIGTLDVAEFEFIETSRQLITRHVFMRSGSILLDFVFSTTHPETESSFDAILRSILITRRPSRFND